jgi:hypothetical protein
MHQLRGWCPALSADVLLSLAISLDQGWLPLHPPYYNIYYEHALNPIHFGAESYKEQYLDTRKLVEDLLMVRLDCTGWVDLVKFCLVVIHVWFTLVTCCWKLCGIVFSYTTRLFPMVLHTLFILYIVFCFLLYVIFFVTSSSICFQECSGDCN